MWAGADFAAQRWRCDDCERCPATRAQRGDCGGAFTEATPGAQQDAAGRWYVPASETARSLASLYPGADDAPVYSCPVAGAAALRRSYVPNLFGATRAEGLPLAALGYAGPLSEGAADAVAHVAAAWAWRARLEADAARSAAKAARGG